ncbi:MAG: DUF4388 domain-containing protein [Kiritimatiellae bacterium]|nr:DUF4388 domain-containing protein [Kiritimatiellia bacterium]
MTPPAETDARSAESVGEEGFLLLLGLVVPLPTDKLTVLGRDNDSCDVALVDEHVSKRHATIGFSAGRYFVEDLGSMNGTFVNGVRISRQTPLVVNDRIRIRPYTMLFVGRNHPQVVKPAQRVLISDAQRHAGHFSGLLKVVPITDLIQLLNSSRQSGILTLVDEKNQRAKLIFIQGDIVAATYVGKMAEEAVYDAMALKQGSFDFMPGTPPTPPSPIRKKTLSLLLEGCRLIDEGPVEPHETLPANDQKTRQLPRLQL